MPDLKLTNNFQKILIVRLSSIGDVLQASAVAHSLKKFFPKAHISWVVEDKSKDVILGHPALDQVFVWSRRGWFNEAKKTGDYFTLIKRNFEFFRRLRQERFDIALNLHGLNRADIVCFISGAKYRICLPNPHERCFGANIRTPNRTFEGRQAIYKRFLSVLTHFGLEETGEPVMEMGLSAEDQEFAERFLGGHGLRPRGFIVFNPSSSNSVKCWPGEYFARLGDLLFQEYKLPIVIFGAASDKQQAQFIAGRMSIPVIDATGTMTLKQLGGVACKAGVFISGDTGPLFIAYALGAPTVALYTSCADAENRHIHYPSSIALHAEGQSLKNLTVEEVWQAVRLILRSQSAPQ